MNKKYYIAIGMEKPPFFLRFLSKIRLGGIELTHDTIKINRWLVFRNNVVFSRPIPRLLQWNNIVGMITFPSLVFDFKEMEVAKIFIKTQRGKLSYLLLESRSFEKADELFADLRTKIPLISKDHDIFAKSPQLSNVNHSSSKYEKWGATTDGIVDENNSIPWTNIITIAYEDFSRQVNGYGNIRIIHRDNNGQENTLSITPDDSDVFRSFLHSIINHAHTASIDPSLLNIFNQDYRRESFFIKVFAACVIVTLLFFIGYFIYGIIYA